MNDLEVCGSCGCHVKAEERSCPFCGASRAASPRMAPVPAPRMSRARLLVVGPLLALGCSSSGGGGGGQPTTQTGTGGQTSAISSSTGGHDGGVHTCYGPPPARLERLESALG
jgi:hypothetical protein